MFAWKDAAAWTFGPGLANLSSVDSAYSATLLGNQDAITGFGARHRANKAGFPLQRVLFR
jgi:hypothetical protein